MTENTEFIYKKEFWYINAFINTSKVDSAVKSGEIDEFVKAKLRNLKNPFFLF